MLKWICRGILVSVLAACNSGDLTLNEADPDIVAQKPTWEQVYPIFQRECIPCHSGTDDGPDEEDEDEERAQRTAADLSAARVLAAVAGTEPGLESCLSIINNLDDIKTDLFVDNNMPPGAWPRLTSREKLIIQRWIDDDPEASCN